MSDGRHPGASFGEPAIVGTYGLPPRGLRLPPTIDLGAVTLRVADLARSVDYYTSVLGLQVIDRTGAHAALGTHGDRRVLVELNESRGVRSPRRRLGLFHFAMLLPERAALGRFLRHLVTIGTRPGASDHLVSEALYLTDPDGLGIEVYADRPQDTWRRKGRELLMSTDPLDPVDLVRSAGDTTWTGMPAGTVMGHVHLHVGDLEQAAAFYVDALGFDRTVWSYPGALFVSAGGYHHHLGTNTWAGPGAQPAGPDVAGLEVWTIHLPDRDSLAATATRVGAAGYSLTHDGATAIAVDPWGTRVRLSRR